MPLISPIDVKEVLRSAVRETRGTGKEDLNKLLENNYLGPNDALQCVSEIMRSGETDQARLKASEMALKLNGLLKSDELQQAPSVTIIIYDSPGEINPILLPRNF